MILRHASFFSGVGGLDLGLERAGIKTVSLSEIDGYASAVLSERFPEVPNLGDITAINAEEVPDAEIWSGGFPCQDLSVAGRRAGFTNGTRSVLAFTFLDLVERRRPRWLLLENVPGILSSNRGRDFSRLVGEVVGLGYSLAYRTLDARFFGVPQRRRRVFIVAALNEARGDTATERAAEVLFECEGGCGHLASSQEEGQEITSEPRGGARGDRTFGADTANAILARYRKGINTTVESGHLVRSPINPDGVRAPNGMAGRVDDLAIVEGSMTGGGFDAPQSQRIYDARGQAPTLDRGKAIPQIFAPSLGVRGDVAGEDLLPHRLDWSRYRCCGNGVVANVAEFIGRRLIAVDRKWQGGAK